MVNTRNIAWPDLDGTYIDEFGSIDPQIYNAAGELWPRARDYSLKKLRDEQLGQRLLINTVANVTARARKDPEPIKNLKGYIYKSFCQLVLAELEKDQKHKEFDRKVIDSGQGKTRMEIDQIIALREIEQLMAPWAYKFWKLLTLGFTHEEIGKQLGENGDALRQRFEYHCQQIKKQLRLREKHKSKTHRD